MRADWLIFSAAILIGGGLASAAGERPAGYLAPGEIDVTSIVEPAPIPGDPRYDSDRRIFRATRSMAGTPRYRLATSDAVVGVPAMLNNFSCAVGVRLTPQNAPRLVAVVLRAAADTGAQSGRAKEYFRRERPYVIDRGPICQPEAELYDARNQRAGYDYPSGHSTWGWTWATILASLAPDRAQRIFERARSYGESRFICGAHNESAVSAGMISAAATMAVVQTKSAFQADLAAAREELEALRAGAQAPPEGCSAEAALIAQPVFPNAASGRRHSR